MYNGARARRKSKVIGGARGLCAFRAGLRVGRARRCVDRGSPLVGEGRGGQRRFRERIESGRGRAHTVFVE